VSHPLPHHMELSMEVLHYTPMKNLGGNVTGGVYFWPPSNPVHHLTMAGYTDPPKTTEKDLPKQTLGHIQYTCETLSTAHIDSETHHQCYRVIHGELVRLSSPEWKFLCISGEKCLQTIWNEIPLEIEGLQYLNLVSRKMWYGIQTIREMDHPLTLMKGVG